MSAAAGPLPGNLRAGREGWQAARMDMARGGGGRSGRGGADPAKSALLHAAGRDLAPVPAPPVVAGRSGASGSAGGCDPAGGAALVVLQHVTLRTFHPG